MLTTETGPLINPDACACWFTCSTESVAGGNRTTGFVASMTILRFLDITDAAGDTIESRPISLAKEERLLIATLGE